MAGGERKGDLGLCKINGDSVSMLIKQVRSSANAKRHYKQVKATAKVSNILPPKHN